ncbi:hypothetical protein SLA_4616 [Streptomyces laurentii]|uniref:Uncharacterized protein n=1 Tax=Streptomyces laurentii TaxID=39478 RepID=A0A160P4J9_STRLU|nr:hypothetical protein SLA_4616 [Streptomyces laurentii]
MPERPHPYTAVHDEPFPELLGNIDQVTVSADGQWIAASSVWHRLSRVVVYRAADLSRAHLLTFDVEAEPIAFHPTIPLLAIGLDNGDAYQRAGGLTLFEADSGHRVDFADPGRGVELVRWADDRTLELTFLSVDLDNGCEFLTSRARAVRDDWRDLVPDALDLTAVDGPPLDPDTPVGYPDTPVRPVLQALAARAGRSCTGRGGVGVVAGLSDGRVLATRHHVALESRAPDGSPQWSVPAPSPSGGTRILVSPDERTARVVAPDFRDGSDLLLVDLADGTVLDRSSLPFPAGLCARTDGVWAIGHASGQGKGADSPEPPATRVFAADGTPLRTVRHEPADDDPVGADPVGDDAVADEPAGDAFLPLDVRRCPELLFLRRRGDVVALDPRSATERVLFTADEPLGGTVYVSDTEGPALLHGRREVVRRSFPAGEVVWRRDLGAAATALDARDGVLHALCEDGTLVSLATADGALLDRRALPPYRALSLHAAPDGTVLVGTVAGQILRY